VTERFVVDDVRPSVSYGPTHPDEDGAYVLGVTTEDGRVEIEFDEESMYHLWVEVRNVPWPEPPHPSEEDELVRRVVHAANHADPDMLYDALHALGAVR